MKEVNVNIKHHSGIYTLESRQNLNAEIDEAWEFFSDPSRLADITPSHMGFKITSGDPGKMYRGQIISYRIGILPLVKSNWVTEITAVVPQSYFIDEQRSGPYSIWHHEHHFSITEEGLEIYDKVSYKIPFGFLGRLMHQLFIKRKLLSIFGYRYRLLDEVFNKRSQKSKIS